LKANEKFLERDSPFWAYVKIISEKLGYSLRGTGELRYYSLDEVLYKLEEVNINYDLEVIHDVVNYLNFRSKELNENVRNLFMNKDSAKEEFRKLYLYHIENEFSCSLPLNKQRNEKRDYSYFTGIINIIAEKTFRDHAQEHNLIYGEDIRFDDNPMSLSYIFDEEKKLIGALSRRFDGAYPSTRNPLAIWEIKEYYYTTTFGSRISDGIYETQLDGFELNDISRETNKDIKHIYFIDDYNTWWNMGRSYLCRTIDMLHKGLVDEVIFGKEVLYRWEDVLKVLLSKKVSQLKFFD
jgi:hypothetical protein